VLGRLSAVGASGVSEDAAYPGGRHAPSALALLGHGWQSRTRPWSAWHPVSPAHLYGLGGITYPMATARGFNTPLASLRSTGGAFSSRVTSRARTSSTSAPSVGRANRLLYAFEVSMQPWRNNQSPAVPRVESAFSSGEESTSLIVPSTTVFCGYLPHWEWLLRSHLLSSPWINAGASRRFW